MNITKNEFQSLKTDFLKKKIKRFKKKIRNKTN